MKTLGKVWNVISTVLVIILVIFALLLVGIRLFGMQTFVVLSGSMEPAYPVGCLLVDKKVSAEELKEGDVITFSTSSGVTVTHRIAEVVKDDSNNLSFRTKGDANEDADAGLVDERNVVGMPVVAIPKLGYYLDFIKHPPGTFIVIAICAFILLISIIPRLFRKETDKPDDRTKE